MNLNNPIEYIRVQMTKINLDAIDLPTVDYSTFSKAPEMYLNSDESVKIYGNDFMGFNMKAPEGDVLVIALADSINGTLVIGANAKADFAYNLADYRWGIEHLHSLFQKLAGANLPKGIYAFMGEFQDMGSNVH